MTETLIAPWFIKEGYTERELAPDYFDDASDITSQQAVYDRAEQVAVLRGADTIIDLGCGRAAKLAAIHERHPKWRMVGVDYGENLTIASVKYPWGKWMRENLDSFDDWLWPIEADEGRVLIICADLVEHLRDPRPLLRVIATTRHVSAIISTPERDLQWGITHYGPPPNECHVREWNEREFGDLLRSCGLQTELVELMPGDDSDPTPRTQCVIAR